MFNPEEQKLIDELEESKEKRVVSGEIYTANENGEIIFNLHPGQNEAFHAKERFILMLCGTQSGKTSFVPIWLAREIELKGHGDYLAISPTYRILEMKFLPEMRKLFEFRLGYEYNQRTKTFTKQVKNPTNGETETTRIICVSTDTDGALESSTAKAAVFDEAGMAFVKASAWQGLVRRLSINQGRVLITTTPYQMGWLQTEVYERCGVDPDYKLVNFRSIDNPSFPDAEYYRVQKIMPKWQFDMFYNGMFTRPSGLIYSDFVNKECDSELDGDSLKITSDGHIIRPFSIPAHWKRYCGVDFGDRNPCVMFIAEAPFPEKTYIVYRELFGKEFANPERIREYGEKVRCIGGALSENDWRDSWAQQKVPVLVPFINDVEAGISHVGSLIKQNRVYIFSTLTETIKEINSYSRQCDDMGEPTDVIADKNKYHRLDALRYVLSEFTADKDSRKKLKKHTEEITDPMELMMSYYSKQKRGFTYVR